jgi:molybdenum cofactor synthesis domain-containing protein
MWRAGVLTVSDSRTRHQGEDLSGDILAERLKLMGCSVVRRELVPDEQHLITEALRAMCEDCALVVTTGGTGLSPRDVTPEATAALLDRTVPGIPEMLRRTGEAGNPRAVLSRGVAGIRAHCLIINLPGSPKAVEEGMDVLVGILPHALAVLRNEPTDHSPGGVTP